MGRGIPCVSLFLIASPERPGFAQSPPDLPNFRAGTTLIEFTVVATDQDGRHVVDLKPEEVSIVDGGHPRDLAFFHYEGAPPAAIRVRAQPLPPGIYTNRPEYAPGPPRNIIAILIDSLNTRAEDQVKVLAHILAFVSAVPSDTRIAIYRTGERVHVVHDFTDDLEGLRKRLVKDGVEAPRDNQQGITVQQMIIEPWQAEAMAATMEASLEARVPGTGGHRGNVEPVHGKPAGRVHHELARSGRQPSRRYSRAKESHLDDERRAGDLGADTRSVAAELHRVAPPRGPEARQSGHCDVSRRGGRRAALVPECECGRQRLVTRRRGFRGVRR